MTERTDNLERMRGVIEHFAQDRYDQAMRYLGFPLRDLSVLREDPTLNGILSFHSEQANLLISIQLDDVTARAVAAAISVFIVLVHEAKKELKA